MIKSYKDLYVDKSNKSMEQICSLSKWSYQKHQLFVQRWFKNSKNKKLLLFHGLGSGKTCSSIIVAKSLLKKNVKKVFVVTPASLKQNYINELLGPCGGFKSIPKNIHVLSYTKFINYVNNNKHSLNNSLVIIDEVQNIISSTGSTYQKFYNLLVTKKSKDIRIILLSGTPIFDKLSELALTINLLNTKDPLPVKNFYDKYVSNNTIINQDDLVSKIKPYISAFKGISPNAYATKKEHFILCPFSSFQEKSYMNSIEETNLNIFNNFSTAFLIGPRMASNIAYPDNSFGSSGRSNFTDKKLSKYFTPNKILKYSTKFHHCFNNILKASGPVFVYSNFVAAGGINDFILLLKNYGAVEWPQIDKKAPFSFGVFRSGFDKENKLLVDMFNNILNSDGSFIKVIIGSPAMKEGISLKNTRQVHILDPYWNNSRTSQIIGRAIRFCSHISLSPKQRFVDVFHYVSTLKSKNTSVDQKIIKISNDKFNLTSQLENILYKAAIDCSLFHNSNNILKSSCLNKDLLKSSLKKPYNKPSQLITKTKPSLKKLNTNVKKSKKPLGLNITIFSKNKNKKINFKSYPNLYKLIKKISYVDNNSNYANIKLISASVKK